MSSIETRHSGANVSKHTRPSDAPQPAEAPASDVRDQVQKILDMIRPAVQMDGGDVELIDVTDEGIVLLRLHGACVGCPSSAITLKAGIERSLKEHVPGIDSVEAID